MRGVSIARYLLNSTRFQRETHFSFTKTPRNLTLCKETEPFLFFFLFFYGRRLNLLKRPATEASQGDAPGRDQKRIVAYSQPRFRTWLKHITAMYNRLRYKIINILSLYVYTCVYVCMYARVFVFVCRNKGRRRRSKRECDVSRDGVRDCAKAQTNNKRWGTG